MAEEGTILIILGLAVGGFLLWKHEKKGEHHNHHPHHNKHQVYTMHHHGGMKNWVEHPHGRRHMGIHDVHNMMHQDILNRAIHPHEIHRNHHHLMFKMHQYDVMLRPLLYKRATGKMSEREFHSHLRTICDHICHEMQLPVRYGAYHIRKDRINHDGSTTDMDNGHKGIFGDLWLSPDHFRYKHHHWLGDSRCKPKIHDLSARQHLAAFTTAGDDDDIHHINLFRGKFTGLARSNNVEIADDYNYQHAPFPPLAVADIFSEDGSEPM